MAERGSFILNVNPRCRENNAAHHTLDMGQDHLMVRRGHPFTITVQSHGSGLSSDQMKLILCMGRNNEKEINVQKGLGVRGKWWFSQMEAQKKVVVVNVHSPPDAPVGKCRMTVLVMSDNNTVKQSGEISFYLLFNPWCKDDEVFMSDQRMLNEYVMNENGIIYTGSWNQIGSRPWNYGQFEKGILGICFQVLDNSNSALGNSKLDLERRSNPVYVCRTVSKMVNAEGDRGVLVGNWSPPFYGGVSPGQWTSSVPILRQWSRSGIRAVKYGQCWVFAGVACTVLRCLGIPTRVITNFSSAHDVDGNLSIDLVENFNSNNQDSVWNFHCWTETWMRRNDLPRGNNGWQLVDPTPQELSQGEFCCGPCPVEAIKEGNVKINYDCRFAFAEVNAVIKRSRILPNGQRQRISVDERTVGRNISTKSVYGDFREDVTLQYKYPEGSAKEREVYLKAGGKIPELTDESSKPKLVTMKIVHGQCVFGTDFNVTVEVKNEGKESVFVKLTMRVMAMSYNSIYHGDCLKQISNVTVPAAQTHREILRLQYKNYARCVSDHQLIRVKVLAEAHGVPLPFMRVSNIPLKMPEINIECDGTCYLWEPTDVNISIINPLPDSLWGGMFTVSGSGLMPKTHVYVTHVPPGKKASVTVQCTPTKTGHRNVMATFTSDKMSGAKGEATMVVKSRH